LAVFWALARGEDRPGYLARPKKGASAATPSAAGTTQPPAPPAQVRGRRELTDGRACVRGGGGGGGGGQKKVHTHTTREACVRVHAGFPWAGGGWRTHRLCPVWLRLRGRTKL
jgi:hypothetical protein